MITENEGTFIIAEAGVNHNGSVNMAIKMIDAAVNAGVDAVKFQTFNANKVVSKLAPKAQYQSQNTERNESQLDMVKKLELNQIEYRTINEYCQTQNIEFISTPFDEESLDFLVKDLQVGQIKISSGDLTNAPLLLKAACTQKPIILSTGMSTLGEIEMALGVLAFGYTRADTKPSVNAFKDAYRSTFGQQALRKNVKLLHCTTEYPAPYDEINLKVMNTIYSAFGLPVGYSDHTMGLNISIAAVACGAVVIEKHFTLDRRLPGPDHAASLEPNELKELVKSIRQVEQALGSSIKIPTETEMKNMVIARRSLVALKEISKDDIFAEDNLGVKRPGYGMSPFNYWDLLGETSKNDYETDQLIVLK